MIATCAAPAKINLGLEILGKRSDGYHEIRTILQMIDLCDRVSVRFGDATSLTCDDPSLSGPDNLAVRAAELWSEQIDPLHRSLHIDLVKRIPSAAGLGGASSDAAAVLMLADALAHRTDGGGAEPFDLTARFDRLHKVAEQLGSDVPFFLGTGCSFAHGRGELLESIEPLRNVMIVLVTPAIDIPRKTATMYGALDLDRDFSDGAIIRDSIACLEAGEPLTRSSLSNAFARPLRALYPEVERIAEIMGFFADGPVGLSGAGPTWYAILGSASSADSMIDALTGELATARIVTARPYAGPVRVSVDQDA